MANRNGHTREQKARYANDARLMETELPFLYSFAKDHSDPMMRNRLGKKRTSFLYRMLRSTPGINMNTKPSTLGSSPVWFWDLLDAAYQLDPEERDYAIDTVIYLFRLILREKRILNKEWNSIHSPAHFLYTEQFIRFLHRGYKRRESVFFLRHGQMTHYAEFYILDYKNTFIREMFVNSILEWKYAWNKRTPSRLGVLPEAEGWFEGTTDGVRSWEDFNVQMLDTAKRHICSQHSEEWKLVCLKFLFYFYSRLILEHPDHDFFKGSLVYCPEMVLDKRTPKHLADGFEFAIYGQLDPFLQGRGVLLVIRDAHLHSASYRKTEIKQYDLSKITNKDYWNAIANFYLHNGRDEVIEARAFLIWLAKYKADTGNDPFRLTADDMEAYRILISKKLDKSGSRNACIRGITKFVRWLKDNPFIKVDESALEWFSYFMNKQNINPQPLEKEDIQKLCNALTELGQDTPRYLLEELIVRILLLCDIRIGSLVSLLLEDVIFLEDGSCKCHILSKTSTPDRQTFFLPPEGAELMRQAITLTEDVRQRCPPYSVKEHLFIYEGVNGRSAFPFNAMNFARFGLDLKTAAKKAGIAPVSPGRLRDTYMTAANLYMIENNIPDYKKPVFTNHKNKKSILNYAIFDIGDILKKCPGRYTVGKILKKSAKNQTSVKKSNKPQYV